MVVDQELASLELVRVHHVQQNSFSTGFPEIFSIELGSHRTPHLGTLEERQGK